MTSLTNPLISIGFDKTGEADFGVVMSIQDLSFEQMNELRRMIPVAIAQAEDIWRRAPQHEVNQPAMSKFASSWPKAP